MKTKVKIAPLIDLIKYALSHFQHVFFTAGAILIDYNPELSFLLQLIKEKGYRLSNSLLRKPWSLYTYCPDQRPLTHHFLGKPDLAHSPP